MKWISRCTVWLCALFIGITHAMDDAAINNARPPGANRVLPYDPSTRSGGGEDRLLQAFKSTNTEAEPALKVTYQDVEKSSSVEMDDSKYTSPLTILKQPPH